MWKLLQAPKQSGIKEDNFGMSRLGITSQKSPTTVIKQLNKEIPSRCQMVEEVV